MFNFFNKNNESDEKKTQQSLDKAKDSLNKGLTGFLSKAVLGGEQMGKINAGLDMAQQNVDAAKIRQDALASGALMIPATVLNIEDTGQMINYNPVVTLTLKVHPMGAEPFDYVLNTMVNKIQIPRIGETINLIPDPSKPGNYLFGGLAVAGM